MNLLRSLRDAKTRMSATGAQTERKVSEKKIFCRQVSESANGSGGLSVTIFREINPR
jgi:hypothetical protein